MQLARRSILDFIAPRAYRSRLPTATLTARNIGATRMVSGALTGSIVVGQDGRKYKRTDALKIDPRKPELLNVYVAESDGESFVAKRVNNETFAKLQRLRGMFRGSAHLHLHVDENKDELVVMYRHMMANLFEFSRDFKGSTHVEAREDVVWGGGKGLEELHAKGYAMWDVKPDNMLCDYMLGGDGRPRVTEARLSDLDSVYNMQGAWLVRPKDDLKHVRFGNHRWRSAEMQTGQGLGLFSDVTSFGFVHFFAVTGELPLGDENLELMAETRGIPISELCLVPAFEFFGLPTPAFLEHIKDEEWQEKLTGIAAEVERSLEAAKKAGDTVKSFEDWGIEDYPDLTPQRHEMLSMMLKITPQDRATMLEVMKHPSWGKRA